MITETLRTITGKIRVSIPENLMELTVGQMIAIQDAENINDLKAISILSGISEEDLANISDIRELSKFNDRILSLSHQIKYCYNEQLVPESIVFGTKKVKILGLFYVLRDIKVDVIKNLSIEPAGAFLASRDIIADEINKHINLYGEESWKEHFAPSINSIALVLAHYFYCRVTGLPYSEQKAEDFKVRVLKLPIQVALPIGRAFFFELSRLIETEDIALAGRASDLEKKAGIKTFEKFGYINAVNTLSGGDVLKWHDILNLPYETFFLKQLLNKTEAIFNKQYQELIIKESKK